MTGAPYVVDKLEDISTHILTKRMTKIHTRQGLRTTHFNSHPHEEDDRGLMRFQNLACISTHILTKRMTPTLCQYSIRLTYFNSHPHEEDDLSLWCFTWNIDHFNSHPHEEDDKVSFKIIDEPFISTHILTKRMTHPGSGFQLHTIISTHILTKRMTRWNL